MPINSSKWHSKGAAAGQFTIEGWTALPYAAMQGRWQTLDKNGKECTMQIR
jgi:hypothetical protein